MKIVNHGTHRSPEAIAFEKLLADIESRELPDIGLYRGISPGLKWNNSPVETLSVKDPRAGDWEYHFMIIRKEVDGQPKMNAILCGTNKGSLAFYQDFEIDSHKLGNLSFEVVKWFLEKTGHITTDRQGIELMYPAYHLAMPEVVEYEPNTFDPTKPKSTESTPLPEIAEPGLPYHPV